MSAEKKIILKSVDEVEVGDDVLVIPFYTEVPMADKVKSIEKTTFGYYSVGFESGSIHLLYDNKNVITFKD